MTTIVTQAGIWVRLSGREPNSKWFEACNNVPANVPDFDTDCTNAYFQY